MKICLFRKRSPKPESIPLICLLFVRFALQWGCHAWVLRVPKVAPDRDLQALRWYWTHYKSMQQKPRESYLWTVTFINPLIDILWVSKWPWWMGSPGCFLKPADPELMTGPKMSCAWDDGDYQILGHTKMFSVHECGGSCQQCQGLCFLGTDYVSWPCFIPLIWPPPIPCRQCKESVHKDTRLWRLWWGPDTLSPALCCPPFLTLLIPPLSSKLSLWLCCWGYPLHLLTSPTGCAVSVARSRSQISLRLCAWFPPLPTLLISSVMLPEPWSHTLGAMYFSCLRTDISHQFSRTRVCVISLLLMKRDKANHWQFFSLLRYKLV